LLGPGSGQSKLAVRVGPPSCGQHSACACGLGGGAGGTKLLLELTIDDGHHDDSCCVRVQGWAGIASPGVLPP